MLSHDHCPLRHHHDVYIFKCVHISHPVNAWTASVDSTTSKCHYPHYMVIYGTFYIIIIPIAWIPQWENAKIMIAMIARHSIHIICWHHYHNYRSCHIRDRMNNVRSCWHRVAMWVCGRLLRLHRWGTSSQPCIHAIARDTRTFWAACNAPQHTPSLKRRLLSPQWVRIAHHTTHHNPEGAFQLDLLLAFCGLLDVPPNVFRADVPLTFCGGRIYFDRLLDQSLPFVNCMCLQHSSPLPFVNCMCLQHSSPLI